jgi:hypothetical protein
MAFIPELTTRVVVKMKTDELDKAIDLIQNDPILGEIPSLISELEDTKNEINDLQEPLVDAVAEGLQSNQEMIISSKHYKDGLMANSVDISFDGNDRLVGNTATSVDGFPYPLAIEKGSRDHWVAPVTYDALHWVEGGKDRFSKGHMVSGISADPFVDESIQNTLWDIDEIINDVIGGL